MRRTGRLGRVGRLSKARQRTGRATLLAAVAAISAGALVLIGRKLFSGRGRQDADAGSRRPNGVAKDAAVDQRGPKAVVGTDGPARPFSQREQEIRQDDAARSMMPAQ